MVRTTSASSGPAGLHSLTFVSMPYNAWVSGKSISAVYIPPDFERDLKADRRPQVVGFYNQQFLTAAGIASSGLSDVLSVASSAAAAGIGATRIQALRSGAININGKPATFAVLDNTLAQVKTSNGVILFYREQPLLPPTAAQKRVFDDIMNAQVPIEFHRAADFSDRASP